MSAVTKLDLVPTEEADFDTDECADCGYEFDIPEGWSAPYEIERLICSTCWAEKAEAYRQKKLAEQYARPADLPEALGVASPPRRTQLSLFGYKEN